MNFDWKNLDLYFWRSFFPPYPARPSRPDAKKNSVAGSGTGTGSGPGPGPGPGLGSRGFSPPEPGEPPGMATGGMKADGGCVAAGGSPPITPGDAKGVGSDGVPVVAGGPPPATTGGVKGVEWDGGGAGVSKASGVGSSGDVFPGNTSDNTLAHRVLVNVVPSVINCSLLTTFNLFFVQKISSPIRYET